jgi:hypothetical protein
MMRARTTVMTIACVIGMCASTCAARADSFVDEAADSELRANDVPRRRVDGPPIAEVLRAAYASAGLDRDLSRGWIRRARLAGLVPWISVRTGRNTRWETSAPEVDYGVAIEVRATWRLDRLVFDGRELQVASVEAARRRERRRLASRVIRAYFAWRRASERLGGPGARDRADEAAAELDALTDGWFSDAVAGPRRTASETRTDREP